MKIQVIRGGKTFVHDKKNRIIELGNNPASGLPRYARPKYLYIEFDEDGKVASAETGFREYDVAGNTRVNPKSPFMFMNKADLGYFENLLAPLIDPGIISGYFRKILGFNFQPLFNAQGDAIPDAVWNTDAPKSDTYETHNATGTAINGVAAENIDTTPWRAPVVVEPTDETGTGL